MYAEDQGTLWEDVDLADPAAREHPLCPDRGWWMVLPGLDGGRFWYDLLGLNPGTLTNMTTSASGWRPTTRPGGYGHLLFDGVTSSVVIGPPSLSTFTWAAWVNVAAGSAGLGGDYGNLTVDHGAKGFWLHSGKLDFYSAGDHLGSTALTTGVWTHLAATYDAASGAAAIYRNGLPDGTYTLATGQSWAFSGVGADSAAGGEALKGSLDDLRLYSRALPAADVRAVCDDSQGGCPRTLNRVYPRAFGGQAAPLFRRTLHDSGTRSGSRGVA